MEKGGPTEPDDAGYDNSFIEEPGILDKYKASALICDGKNLFLVLTCDPKTLSFVTARYHIVIFINNTIFIF